MSLTLDEIYGYRLGSILETFHSWNDNLPISREAVYQAVKQDASLLHQGIPPHPPTPDATAAFLNKLTEDIHFFRPDLMNAFMLGRAAARLILVSAMAAAIADYDSPGWQELWENTEAAVLFGASKLNISRDKALGWIDKVRNDPRKWHNTEALIA